MASSPVAGIPTAAGLGFCLKLFTFALSKVAIERSMERGPEWIPAIVPQYVSTITAYMSDEDIERAIENYDERDFIVLIGLQVEMLYYARRFAFPDGLPIDAETAATLEYELSVVADTAYVGSAEADSVKEGLVIKGSLQFLLDKLPWYLRRLVDAISEALQISRGAF